MLVDRDKSTAQSFQKKEILCTVVKDLVHTGLHSFRVTSPYPNIARMRPSKFSKIF